MIAAFFDLFLSANAGSFITHRSSSAHILHGPVCGRENPPESCSYRTLAAGADACPDRLTPFEEKLGTPLSRVRRRRKTCYPESTVSCALLLRLACKPAVEVLVDPWNNNGASIGRVWKKGKEK